MGKAWPGSQGGTYGANAVACAAAVATFDVIRDEGLVDNSAQRGAQLKEALQLVADKHDQITDVRGLGLMIGNEFRDAAGKPDPVTAAAAQQEAASRGLLLLTCGAWGQVVRFIPALVVNSDQVDEAASIWADAVSAVVSARPSAPRWGCFSYSSCGGAPAVPGISVPFIGQRVVSGTLIMAIAPMTHAAIM